MFLGKKRTSQIEPFPVAMVGARMGDRVLQVGVDDPATAGLVAAKVGLSGTAAFVVTGEADAERARRAAAEAAALADVKVTSLRRFPFEDGSFDLAVIHDTRGFLASLGPEDRVGCLQETHRVLRRGGRAIVIDAVPRGGLARLFRGHHVNEHYLAGGGAEGALRAEGFAPVRVLAEREGYKFTEGLKT
jgi:SAM-dependent methyltransferase